MSEFKLFVISIVKPLIDTSRCKHCGATILRNETFCKKECARRSKVYEEYNDQKELFIAAQTKLIEKLKTENLRPLNERIARIEKENACLIEENLALRHGCEQIQALDNPAVRWIHRALRNADLIRKNFKKS